MAEKDVRPEMKSKYCKEMKVGWRGSNTKSWPCSCTAITKRQKKTTSVDTNVLLQHTDPQKRTEILRRLDLMLQLTGITQLIVHLATKHHSHKHRVRTGQWIHAIFQLNLGRLNHL